MEPSTPDGHFGPPAPSSMKVVSERLGHASPAFTMTVYQHIVPGMQADAATVFSDLVATALKPSRPSRAGLHGE